jgi:hypothetical protein
VIALTDLGADSVYAELVCRNEALAHPAGTYSYSCRAVVGGWANKVPAPCTIKVEVGKRDLVLGAVMSAGCAWCLLVKQPKRLVRTKRTCSIASTSPCKRSRGFQCAMTSASVHVAAGKRSSWHARGLLLMGGSDDEGRKPFRHEEPFLPIELISLLPI